MKEVEEVKHLEGMTDARGVAGFTSLSSLSDLPFLASFQAERPDAITCTAKRLPEVGPALSRQILSNC